MTIKLRNKCKRSASSKQWLLRQLNDPYVKQAKAQGYRSRAAFKLLDIQKKYRLLKPGMIVLDCGSAPGGWSQVASQIVKAESKVLEETPQEAGEAIEPTEKTGESAEEISSTKKRRPGARGKVLALDLLDMPAIPGVLFWQKDFTEEETIDFLCQEIPDGIDVLLSDMAPSTSGIASVDHGRIVLLVEEVFELACRVLKPKGSLVVKVWQGGTEGELLRQLKKLFASVNHFKPPSSRQGSAELYLVAQGFKAPQKER